MGLGLCTQYALNPSRAASAALGNDPARKSLANASEHSGSCKATEEASLKKSPHPDHGGRLVCNACHWQLMSLLKRMERACQQRVWDADQAKLEAARAQSARPARTSRRLPTRQLPTRHCGTSAIRRATYFVRSELARNRPTRSRRLPLSRLLAW